MSIIASPYPSHWCLLLGSAGVSPPPSGPHDRPSAWLCSPARKERWSLTAELQGRACPWGKDPSQEGREISRGRVQGRTVTLQWLGSGWSRAGEPSGGPLVQARFTDKAWGGGGAHTSSHNTLAVGPGPEAVYLCPRWEVCRDRESISAGPTSCPSPNTCLLLTRSWKSTVAPLSRSFSRISMWPSREARCRAVRRNCPQRNSQGPSLSSSSTQVETRAYPCLILTPVLGPHMVHILPAPSCSVGPALEASYALGTFSLPPPSTQAEPGHGAGGIPAQFSWSSTLYLIPSSFPPKYPGMYYSEGGSSWKASP